MKNILVYNRGFLGFDNGVSTPEAGASLEQIITAIKLNRDIPKKNPGVSNNEINTLWKQFRGGDQYVTSFEFRENILLAALDAFGTKDFREWLNIQGRSPYLTEMHRRFLNDTLRFILNGTRAAVMQNWRRLIQPTDITPNDRDVPVEFGDFFAASYEVSALESSAGLGEKPTAELTSVLHQWVSREGGHEDLIETLHILFGSED
jgi:hypothetical protein